MRVKDDILRLRAEGKSYGEIQAALGCSKGTIAYHCGNGQKEKYKRTAQRNRSSIFLGKKVTGFTRRGLQTKTDQFRRERIWKYEDGKRERIGQYQQSTFSYVDVLNHFGRMTRCYLTGRRIDLFAPKTYTFDHKIPVSRSGDNSIDNLGIACKAANQAKHDLTVGEFLELCKEVLNHHGYKITK